MAILTRRNAWNNQGTFNNPDLLWYAKGVHVMQSRQLSEPTSWWFFGAIHGQHLINFPRGYPNWADIPGPPNVPTAPLPPKEVIRQYWDQCQHGSWFFPPWHRGYLYAIENILRVIIQNLGGPSDWALPYWNYFGPSNEFQIPPAFTQRTLPDGSLNSLFVAARYGPNSDGKIFIPLSSWGITQLCQRNNLYVGESPDYYGGGVTGFEHSADQPGALEYNPHNFVHGAIGGQDISSGRGGLMAYPTTAALDPIFYLHHGNIDRMWAAWNAAGNKNPTDSNWLNGPSATGDRKFYQPNPDGRGWYYTPAMVNDTTQLNYTYDDLSLGAGPMLVSKNAVRMRNFGFPVNEVKSPTHMDRNITSELVGVSNAPLRLGASGARTNVKLDSSGWSTVTRSLEMASINRRFDKSNLPDEVYLQLEGVKGTEDSVVCSVSVNQQYAGHISLFGLRNASAKDNAHGGAGLTIKLNITKIIDRLHLSNAIETNSLDVLIQPVNTISEGNELTIGRVGIYRKGQR